jgi:hypothetical protein
MYNINAVSYFKALYLEQCGRTDKEQKQHSGQFPTMAVATGG